MSARRRSPSSATSRRGARRRCRSPRFARESSSNAPAQGAEDHATSAGLQRVVYRRHPAGGAGRLLAGARLHGHPAPRLPHVGADAGGPGRDVQGDGARSCHFPSLSTPQLPRARGRASGGIREGSGDRDTDAPAGHGEGGRGGGGARSQLGAGGAARRAPDVGDDHLRDVREVDPQLPRSAAALESMVQRGPLGAADAAVPAHYRVPVAGRAHGARDGGGGGSGGAEDSRRVPAGSRGGGGGGRGGPAGKAPRGGRGGAPRRTPRGAGGGR